MNLYLGQYSIWNCIWHGWVAGYIFASAYSREALESKRLILFSTPATQIFFGARINGRAPEHVIMVFLDAIASPSTFPCQWVSQSVMIDSFRLEIAIASPSFASLLLLLPIRWSLYWYFVITTQIIRQAIACQSVTQESCDHWEIRVILRRPTETMTRSMTITTTMKMKYRGQNICSRWCPSYLWPLWEMFWSRHLKGRSELCVRTYVCGYVGNTFCPTPYPGTIIIETCQKEYNICTTVHIHCTTGQHLQSLRWMFSCWMTPFANLPLGALRRRGKPFFSDWSRAVCRCRWTTVRVCIGEAAN